jgi:DNA helicase-2/ATP-dependent DNA helicase PcrA
MLSKGKFFSVIREISGKEVNRAQKKVIETTENPLWVVAGPGTGKTEVLVLRTLYLLLVKGVPPRSIVIVTFTRDAAEEITTRIINYIHKIRENFPYLPPVEPLELRMGTLHSLANSIMEEFRFPEYENIRLMDDFEQKLFILNHTRIMKDPGRFSNLWQKFSYLWNRGSSSSELRERFNKLEAAVKLFNMIVEYLVNVERLSEGDEASKELKTAYKDYLHLLETYRRLDLSHLQKKFLSFLCSKEGKLFLEGNDTSLFPGIRYVMIDEYQDTNPIGERIYFKLAEKSKNICVVGDNDQALFRFRGGTVDCILNFDKACKEFLGVKNVKPVFLHENYRSDRQIVAFINYFKKSFLEIDEIEWKKGQIEGKKPLKHSSGISSHEVLRNSICPIFGRDEEELGKKLAAIVKKLKEENVIEDYSACVLLLPSTREMWNSEDFTLTGHLRKALEDAGIPVYNPRSKALLEKKEIKGIIGALIKTLDPDLENVPKFLIEKVNEWTNAFNSISSGSLKVFTGQFLNSVKNGEVELLEIFYRIISFQPFRDLKEDFSSSLRISTLSRIIGSYSLLPSGSSFTEKLGKVQINNGKVDKDWLEHFYYSLVSILATAKIDEPERPSKSMIEGHFPIMTFHQAKGLEFPIVFVANLTQGYWREDDINLLEDDLKDYMELPYNRENLSPKQRSVHDTIRKFYVAYSRHKYALFLLIRNNEREKLDHEDWENYLGFPAANPKNLHKFMKSFKKKMEKRNEI